MQLSIVEQVLSRCQTVVKSRVLRQDTDRGTHFLRLAEQIITRNRAVPLVGFNKVLRSRIVVVLPAPFGPRRPKTSPLATSKVTWSTAVNCPNFLVSEVHCINACTPTLDLNAMSELV